MATRYTLIHSGKKVTDLAATAVGDKNKYLHSNSSTGALEWSSASSMTDINTIKSFTADQTITAGMPVGISNGVASTVAKAYRTQSVAAHSITTPLFTGTNNNSYCAIGGDKFVMLNYTAADSGTLFAQVGSIDTTTKTLTLGTASAVATAFTPDGTTLKNACIAKLATDKFVVFYVLDASTTVIKYRVGTVSGTTISWGSEATASTAGSTVAASNCFTAAYLADDKGVFVYKAGTTTNSKMVVYTCATTTLTFGAEVTPEANSQADAASMVKKIATDKFVLVTANAANSLYAQVCTVSTRTITAGTEAQISTSTSAGSLENLYVVSPADDVFIARVGGSSTTCNLTACTVSTRTITAGTTAVVATPTGVNGNKGGIYMIDASTLWCSIGASAAGRVKYTLSGTTLTAGISVGAYLSGSALEAHVNMDNGYYICIEADSTNIGAWVDGMSNGFIGIAQGAAVKGESVNVVVRGIDTNQTGLVAGTTYQIIEGGTLSALSSVAVVDNLNEQFYVKAVSATEIVI